MGVPESRYSGGIPVGEIDRGVSGKQIILLRHGDKIELESYGPHATLVDLAAATEAFRDQPGLITAGCKGCALCCYFESIPLTGIDLIRLSRSLNIEPEQLVETHLTAPTPPSLEARKRGIRDLTRMNGLSSREAAILYEFNQAEPITPKKRTDGGCTFLDTRLCGIYEDRPFLCMLYVCNMADKLSILHELIVRQGVWHSYAVLGWIPEIEISHNPFVGKPSYDKVLLADFDVNLEKAMEDLFFFF